MYRCVSTSQCYCSSLYSIVIDCHSKWHTHLIIPTKDILVSQSNTLYLDAWKIEFELCTEFQETFWLRFLFCESCKWKGRDVCRSHDGCLLYLNIWCSAVLPVCLVCSMLSPAFRNSLLMYIATSCIWRVFVPSWTRPTLNGAKAGCRLRTWTVHTACKNYFFVSYTVSM